MMDVSSTTALPDDPDALREIALRSLRGKSAKRRRIDSMTESIPSTAPSETRNANNTPVPQLLPLAPLEVLMEEKEPPAPEAPPPPPMDSDQEEGEIIEEDEAPDAIRSFPPGPNTFQNNELRRSPSPLQRRLSDPSLELARPGYLDLTESELRSCKDLILDLLAMDFPSEHLLTIGIRPALLAICFIELNLILPHNFPLEDIPPLPYGTITPPSLAHLSEHLIPRLGPDSPPPRYQDVLPSRSSLDDEVTPRSGYSAMELSPIEGPSRSPLSPRLLIRSATVPSPSQRERKSASPPRSPLRPVRRSSLLSPPRPSPLSLAERIQPLPQRKLSASSLPYPPSSLPPTPINAPTQPPRSRTPPVVTSYLSALHASLPPKPLSSGSRPSSSLSTASEAKQSMLAEPRLSVEPVEPLPRPPLAPTTPEPTQVPIITVQEAQLREQLQARKAKAALLANTQKTRESSPSLALAEGSDAARLQALREEVRRSRQRRSTTPVVNESSSNGSGTDTNPIEAFNQPAPLADPEHPQPKSVLVEITTPPFSEPTKVNGNLEGTPSVVQPASQEPTFNRNGKRLRATDLFSDDIIPDTPKPLSPMPSGSGFVNREKAGRLSRQRSLLPGVHPEPLAVLKHQSRDWVECVIEVSEDEGDDEEDEDDTENDRDSNEEAQESPDSSTHAAEEGPEYNMEAKLESDVVAFLNGAVASVSPTPSRQEATTPPTPSTPIVTAQSDAAGLAYAKKMADILRLKAMIAQHEAKRKTPKTSNAGTPSNGPQRSGFALAAEASPLTAEVLADQKIDEDGDQVMEDGNGMGSEAKDDRSPSPALSHPNGLDEGEADQGEFSMDVNQDSLAVFGIPTSVSTTDGILSETKTHGQQELPNVSPTQTKSILSQEAQPSRFHPYQSPLGRSGTNVQDSSLRLPDGVLLLQTGRPIDLLPLKLETLSNLDPTQRMCKFEIPGGGTCLDPQCPDIHIRDLQPSDQDTAKFLAAQFPDRQATQFMDALQTSRAHKTIHDFSSRVLEALRSLGLR